MLVTDVKRVLKNGEVRYGYYMQGYMKENLDGIPSYLKKGWDVIAIYSGHGKVRIGKSTKAFQDAYYTAWRLAGGKHITVFDQKTKKFKIVETILPTKPVRFDLYENVVFKPEDLVERAIELHKKYGKHQVIVYDEGREGLDSKVMDNINQIMEDFFQKCGYMGHVIFIVLPNYFKLHEDYAVSRSLYLVDCFADKKKRRGYFNFYDETQKEWLYFLGKKRIGITQKYMAANESFWGKFTSWIPFDKAEYDALKEKSLKRKSVTRTSAKWKKQRDAALFMVKDKTSLSNEAIAKELSDLSGIKTDEKVIRGAVMNITGQHEETIEDD